MKTCNRCEVQGFGLNMIKLYVLKKAFERLGFVDATVWGCLGLRFCVASACFSGLLKCSKRLHAEVRMQVFGASVWRDRCTSKDATNNT